MAEHIIRVIDFETTGMEPPAEVCEVATCDLTSGPEGWSVGQPVGWLCKVSAMPPEARAVHHITLDMVEPWPPFDAAGLVETSDHCAVIAAHNMEFEERWLQADGIVPLLCTLKAALRVWPGAPGHSNGVLRYWLEDQGLISLDHDTAMPPHRAGPGVYVTATRGRALARCHDDYRAFNPISFGDFLKIARARKTDADASFGAKIRVSGVPAYRVGTAGQYVRFVRPGESETFNSHPADVTEGWA